MRFFKDFSSTVYHTYITPIGVCKFATVSFLILMNMISVNNLPRKDLTADCSRLQLTGVGCSCCWAKFWPKLYHHHHIANNFLVHFTAFFSLTAVAVNVVAAATVVNPVNAVAVDAAAAAAVAADVPLASCVSPYC